MAAIEVCVERADDGRTQCDASGLAALATDLEHPVAFVVSVVADVGAEGLADAQPAAG